MRCQARVMKVKSEEVEEGKDVGEFMIFGLFPGEFHRRQHILPPPGLLYGPLVELNIYS